VEKRFLYLVLLLVVIFLVILAWQDAKKQTPSPLSKLDVTPTLTLDASSIPKALPTPTVAPTPIIYNSSPSAVVDLGEGLTYQDFVVGKGQEVKSGDTITVHYKGTLENGTQFDSSYDRKEPFTVQIGVGKVIEGWDLGIIGMKVGGKRILTIPPSLGYGNEQMGSIPPNSTLIFQVELMAIK